MAEQYVSIKTIHNSITKHPLMQSVTLEAIVDYTIEFMGIVGVPDLYVKKVETKETTDHRIKLPCDYIEMIQMRGNRGVYHKATDTFHLKPREEQHKPSPCDCQTEARNSRRRNGALCLECPNNAECTEKAYGYNGVECITILSSMKVRPAVMKPNTYITQDSVIFLSNKCDKVDISYLAVATDSEGYPVIPDNEKFKRGLRSYIKKEVFGVLYDTNQISRDVMFKAEQDYAWDVGAASSAAHEIDLPRIESISQAMHGIINRRFEYDKQFATNANPIVMKTH